jgi:phosphohistidine phosphatase
MKTLYLIRHAKSYWGDQSINDFDRTLNKRGKKDAPFMGDVLKDKNVKPDLIISSPAKRAKKTAIEIAVKLNYPDKEIQYKNDIYEATSDNILSIINTIENKYSEVMLFGHNPGLTLLNNYISNNYIENIPTCGVVALSSNMQWSEIGAQTCKHLFFEYPKLYSKS